MKQSKHGWDSFRPYRQGDLGRVWACLREEDLRELSAGGLTDPVALEDALTPMGAKMLTWDTNDGPVAVLGVTPSGDPLVGLVWAVASDLARPRWRFAVRETEGALEWLAADYSVLANFKDARNINQIKWLQRVGFTFIARHAGENGLTYLEFLRIMK
jgi:hypothetical protein